MICYRTLLAYIHTEKKLGICFESRAWVESGSPEYPPINRAIRRAAEAKKQGKARVAKWLEDGAMVHALLRTT